MECTLTNNVSSPLFDTTRVPQIKHKTVNFDANRPVRSVQAAGSECVKRITFLDKDDAEIDVYCPKQMPREGKIHVIEDNEVLIGVYGVRNKPGL